MKSLQIFKQRVDCWSEKQIIDLISQRSSKHQKSLIFALNVNILLLLHNDPTFKEKHAAAATVIFPDGQIIVWLGKLLGNYCLQRVSGTDLTEKLLENRHNKIFLLGTSDKVLKQIASKYKSVVSFFSPPYQKEWNLADQREIIDLINRTDAKILLVALTPLKQEKWLIENFHALNQITAGIGVGSALDILSAEIPRAPLWLQKNGLEWFWRLILEPRRLGIRYFADFFKLIKLIVFG